MFHEGFAAALTSEMAEELRRRALISRGAALTATSLAESGHPGGSLSSMEIYTVLYSCARLRADQSHWPDRDRIVVSHGHTSPGVYSALACAGFFPIEEVEAHFRQAGSLFEGHVERSVPGVEWSTGNLGQGLSAGVGMALGARMTGGHWHTYVVMSDGEQHKGQVAEARRLASKEGLVDLTVIVDCNGIQISGRTSDVMPVSIAEDFAADGWRVIEVDGHDIEAVHGALAEAVAETAVPVCIVAHTVIGKGVSFMEGEPEYHGRGLTPEEYVAAMGELGLEPRLEAARAMRDNPVGVAEVEHRAPVPVCATGAVRTYAVTEKTDNRSAWGQALFGLAKANPDLPIAVLDCDLAASVKTGAFAKQRPQGFIQCGVGEHNAATVAGALSTSGVLTFWSDFGVFGCDEVYNQQRLNDINGAAVKLALTHCGIDVGEDGKTHQCLDYVGAFRELFDWRVIVPADPNQTDRAVRAMPGMQGNVAIAMGRSKLPVLRAEDGSSLFSEDYEYRYGRITWAREGADATLLAMGTTASSSVAAADLLADEGYSVAVGIVSAPLHLDEAAMRVAAASALIVTVEDHNVRTGLGASVAEWLALAGIGAPFERIGIDAYQPSGSSADLMRRTGLDPEGIAASLRGLLGR